MSMFSVEDNVLNEISSQLDAIAKEIQNQESQLRRVQNGIYSSKSLQNKGYASKVSNLKNSVSKIENTVNDLSSRLLKIAETYRQYENRVVKEGNGKAKGKGSPWDNIDIRIKVLGGKLGDLRVLARSSSGALGCDLAGIFSKDPVNLVTGNYVYEDNFFDFDTPIPLKLRIFYNSQNKQSGVLGVGWMHSFEEKLQIKDNLATIIMDDASQLAFYEVEPNSFLPINGGNGLLTSSETEYVYTSKDHIDHVFNKNGLLIRMEQEAKYTVMFQYDNLKLSRVSDTYKNELLFDYDSEGHVIEVKDHSGRAVSFSYEDGNLVSVTDLKGSVTSYKYQDCYLTSIINNEGVVVLQNTYDKNGRITKQQFPDGGVESYEYDDDHQAVILTEQNGSKITYKRDELNRAVETDYSDGKEQYTYDSNNQRTSYTNKRGYKSLYEYDDFGNLISSENAVGDVVRISYEDNQITEVSLNDRRIAEYEYNENHLMVTSVNAVGGKASMDYDSKGQLTNYTREDGSTILFEYDDFGNITLIDDDKNGKTTYEYDAAHNVTKTIDALGNETVYTYDNNRNLTRVINAAGFEETYEYDSRNNLCSINAFDGAITRIKYNNINKMEEVVFPDGNKVHYLYDTMWNLVQATDENGFVTSYQYDDHNNLTKILYPNGTEETASYDPCGNLIHRIAQDGAEFHFDYDPLDRRTHGEDAQGFYWDISYTDTGKVEKVTYNGEVSDSYTYDDMGNMLSHTNRSGYTVNYSYNALGKLEQVFDDSGWIMRREYYPGGNLKKEMTVDGAFKEYEYDAAGRIVILSDETGTWKYEYDCLGQPIRCQHNDLVEEYSYDAAGNISKIRSNGGDFTEYKYNKRGNLEKVLYANGGMTRFDYDNCSRIVSVIRGSQTDDSDNRIFHIQWDEMGNEVAYTRPDGSKTAFEYDPCGRLTRKTQPDGSYIDSEYNSDGSLKRRVISDGREVRYKYNALKQLSEIEDWLGTMIFKQDPMGNLEQVTDQYGNETSYEYSDRGELTKITYPDQRKAVYEYDDAFHRTATKFDDNLYSYVYDDFGRLLERHYPGNLSSHYRYSQNGEIQEISHLNGDETMKSFNYFFDCKGRIERILEHVPDKETVDYRFEYDNCSFLKAFSKDGSRTSYEYDLFGNRLRQSVDSVQTDYSYNNLDQLVSISDTNGTKEYSYDLMGNLARVTDNGTTIKQFTYDALGRLASAECNSNKAQYKYNALSMRTEALFDINGNEDRRIYGYDYTRDDQNLLYQCGNVSEDVLWDDWLLGSYYEGGSRQILTDELLTPAVQVAENGGMQVGERGIFGKNSIGDALLLPLAFTGYLADPVTGLLHAYHREYDPETGRFTSRDAILSSVGLPTAMNEYAYCEEDPVNKVDFDGKSAVVAAGLVTAAVRVGGVFTGDVIRSVKTSIKTGKVTWNGTRIEDYAGAAAGGFAQGAVTVAVAASTGSITAARAAGGAAGAAGEYLVGNGLKMITNAGGYRDNTSGAEFFKGLAVDTAVGAGTGLLHGVGDKLAGIDAKSYVDLWKDASKIKIEGITKGKGSYASVFKAGITKYVKYGYKMSTKVMLKGLAAFGLVGTLDALLNAGIDEGKSWLKKCLAGLLLPTNAKCPLTSS